MSRTRPACETDRRFANREADASLGQTPITMFVLDCELVLGLDQSATDQRTRRLLHRLAEFATATGMPLERELIFDPDTIERFFDVAIATDRSRATYRAVLRSVAPRLTTRAPWTPRPTPVKRRQLAAPYTRSELELLLDDADLQATRSRRRAAHALMTLGLGAGLDGRWATKVEASNVARAGECVLVDVGEPKPRAVPVLFEFEAAVLDLASTSGQNYLVGGRSSSRNRAGHLSASLHVPTGHPRLVPARLRSTWLLRHLEAGTRLDELCAAAGVQGTAIFADLLDYLEPLGADEAVTMLAGRR